MQKLICLTVSLLIVMTSLFAQSNITGVVKDEKGAAIQAATVSLLSAIDSSWLQSELTGDKGEFKFSDIKQGKYLVNIQAAGYQRMFQLVSTETKELSIALKAKSTELQEVTVSSKAPHIEKGLGKMTLNFEQANTQGDNVLDLLRKSPGVSISNGNISMRGTGVQVLIDDKQTYLSGQDLEDYLKSLSAGEVTALELITQPSSKYDAEGSGGIINIKTRKIRKKGINGNVSLAGEQGIYGNTHNNANLTYRKNKLTMFANAGYMSATGCLDRIDHRKVTDMQTARVTTETGQIIFMKETFSDANLKLGADYNVNDKVTLGGSVKGAYHPNTEEDKSKTTIIGQNGELTHNNTTVNQGLVRNNYLCNAYAKYKPAKEQEIIVDADYLYRKQHGDQLVTSYNYDMNLQSLPGQNLRDDKLSIIQVTVGKADYNVKLSDDCKLEAGIKCSYASADKNEYFETGNNGAWAYDTIRSSHFVYKENINAVYASVNKSFGKKWETQAGLRVENTGSNGNQITQGKEFDNNYTSFFPTAFVSYKVDDKNSVELSCGRRIERPAYTMMDPFITFFSQYYYHAGNPNLLPAYRMYVDLNHNYNNTLFTSVGCGKVNGVITPVLQYTGTTNSIFATWGNYADRFVANASVNFNKQVNKWWLLETYGAAYYNRFYGYKSNRYLAESIGYSIHMHHQFTLKHGWGVDTTIYYNSGDLQNLVDRYGPNYWLGFNVSKKIMKDSATIRLSVEDPFRTYNPNSVSNWNGIETASSLRFNSQSVGLGFTYNFGKKIEGAQQRQANTEEAGRM